MLSVTLKIRSDGRPADRRVMVGDDIIVSVESIRGNQVLIGIQAPDGVLILREKLLSPERVAEIEAAAGVRS